MVSLHAGLSVSITVASVARCSAVVRAFAHGAMGRRIDPSWGGPSQCSTTGVTKAVVCAILSVG